MLHHERTISAPGAAERNWTGLESAELHITCFGREYDRGGETEPGGCYKSGNASILNG